MRPIRVSRRVALGGAAATGAAFLAGSALAQSGASTPSGAPSVPAPDDQPANQLWEAPVFDDVLIEQHVGPGVAFAADPAVAPPPFDPRGGPFAFKAFPLSPATLKEQLASAKADRDFASGKMDLTQVNALLASAESLIGQAESKQPGASATPTTESPQPGVVIRKIGPLAFSREGRLAAAQLQAAQAQLEAGVADLPSHARRSGQELTIAHRMISEAGALAANSSEARGLVGQAQALYKQAYDAYQAGQHDKASASARAALATADAARLTAEPEPAKPSATPAAPPPPTF